MPDRPLPPPLSVDDLATLLAQAVARKYGVKPQEVLVHVADYPRPFAFIVGELCRGNPVSPVDVALLYEVQTMQGRAGVVPPTAEPVKPAEEVAPPPLAPKAAETKTGEEETFRPNDNQQAIMSALEFRALRTDELIQESGVCRGKLYQRPKGGIHELRERGIVRLHPKHGYYLPDAPPEELMNGEENEMPERKNRPGAGH